MTNSNEGEASNKGDNNIPSVEREVQVPTGFLQCLCCKKIL